MAQHCFIASFRRCFPFFTLHDQLEPQQKHSLWGWRNAARWLVDLLGHEQICCATSCVFDEKRATKPKFVAQSRPALYFSQHHFFQPATNVFVARQVDHLRWKTGNIDENLQQNNVARQVEGFCFSYFAALRWACSQVSMRRKMLFTIFKYLFSSQNDNTQISQVMTSYTQSNLSQLIFIRNLWFFSVGFYLMCSTTWA